MKSKVENSCSRGNFMVRQLDGRCLFGEDRQFSQSFQVQNTVQISQACSTLKSSERVKDPLKNSQLRSNVLFRILVHYCASVERDSMVLG